MYQPDTVSIDRDHYALLAEHGTRIAVVLSINLEAELIVGVHTYHEYEGTYVTQSCHPQGHVDRIDTYSHLLNYYGDDADVVRKHLQDIIKDQKHSDDPTPFTWELVTGTDDVQSNTDLLDTLDTVVSPDRLDPPFDIPDDEPVTTISCSYEEHEIINDANQRYGYAAVTIERFRGETYIIGLTEERADTIAEGCFKLKQEYKSGDHHDAVQAADNAESIVHNAGHTQTA